jgi:aminoglycoside/choline kinase family phosphotransferase
VTDTTEPPGTIADAPEALTPGWLTAALTSSGCLEGARVTGVERRPLGTGQMCDSLRLTLSYDRETPAPATLVAKLPASDEQSRTTAVLLQNYVKEVRFYRELAAGLTASTPAVHYADIDTAGGSFVLLLEDLAPAEQGDQLAGCSPEVAAAAIEQLVGIHAPHWGDESLASLRWLSGDPDAGRAMMRSFLPPHWDGFLARYGEQLTAEVVEAGEQIFANLDAYLRDRGGPKTLVHGDFRLDNLLIDRATGQVAVVDWQTCSVGPGLADVAYFIGAGLLVEDRRRHEESLVRRYHEHLAAAGVTGYRWDDAWLAYRRGTWSGLIMAVAASMLVERTARGDQMFLAMARRHARHALDLDALSAVTSRP